MSNYVGHIRLPRSLLKPSYEWLFKSPLAWSLYTQMIMEASWKDGLEVNGKVLQVGQVWGSTRYWAKRFNCSQKTISNIITHLVTQGMARLSDRLSGVYEILYYEKFSGVTQEVTHDMAQKRISNNKVSKDTTCTLSQTGNKVVPGKRKRRSKKANVSYTPEYEELWDLWPRPLDDKQAGAVAYFGYLERNNQIHSHVMECARSYLSTVSDLTYCKALANWLNSDSIERKINATTSRLYSNATEGPEPGKLGLSEEQKANRLRRLAEITKNTPAGPRRPGG